MTAKEIFAVRLYELREEKGVSRQKAADDLGITRASLEYYEKGKRTPDINTIALIAGYYGVSADYLFGISDCPSTQSDIRMICDYTGLDERVLELFHKEKEMAEEIEISSRQRRRNKNFDAYFPGVMRLVHQKAFVGVISEMIQDLIMDTMETALNDNKSGGDDNGSDPEEE